MSQLFAGMGALTNAIHGATILVTPDGGSEREIHAVFREEPTTITLPNGTEQITVIPMLRGPKDIMGDLKTDDIVKPGNGNTYRVDGAMPTMNPSTDGHVVFKLEKMNVSPAS